MNYYDRPMPSVTEVAVFLCAWTLGATILGLFVGQMFRRGSGMSDAHRA